MPREFLDRAWKSSGHLGEIYDFNARTKGLGDEFAKLPHSLQTDILYAIKVLKGEGAGEETLIEKTRFLINTHYESARKATATPSRAQEVRGGTADQATEALIRTIEEQVEPKLDAALQRPQKERSWHRGYPARKPRYKDIQRRSLRGKEPEVYSERELHESDDI